MSFPMIRRLKSSGSVLGYDGFDDYKIEQTIRSEQYKETRKAFKKYNGQHLVPGVSCCLKELGRILVERGHSQLIQHQETSISEHLLINIDGVEFELDKPTFPKRKHSYLTINIPSLLISKQIESSYTPESFADFLVAIKEWISTYMSIEERVIAQEKQREMACKVALDLLVRTAEPVLKEKGYDYIFYGPDHKNNASLRIHFGSVFEMTLEVNLMENFVNKLKMVLGSLPPNEAKFNSMSSFKNILNCGVIEDFDDHIIKDLNDGGNNIIRHEGKLWIPNMSASAIEKAKKGAYLAACYTSEEILPENAPLASLKAVNDKLDVIFEDLSDSEKKSSIERIIDGVGYSAHYNRHRFKMPVEVLKMSDE